ncbi:MAG: NosD domain-containing protein [Cytophagaceae bacterium]
MRNISFLIKIISLGFLILAQLIVSQQANSATYLVSSNADAGVNTLRQAIINANGSAGADIINFNFGVPTTITLATCLPQITGQLTIDGYSDPGASAGNLMIEVISPAGCNGFDLASGSGGSIITGMVISGGTTGIYLRNSNGHTIKGNYLGTNRAGTAIAASRLQDCIHLNTSANSTIGGTGGQTERNIISGATQDGIRLETSTGTIIINNYIGTDVTGNLNLGNTGNGIEGYSNSHNMSIGGSTVAEMNVISANHSNGVYLNTCQSPVVKGNIFGMGLDGITKLGNGASGIDIENTGTAATKAVIGGPTASERNYSSCNGAFGVVIRSAPGGIIQGNWLGVDIATGNLDYGNYDAAITVTNTADVQCLGNICSGSGNPGGGADGISIWSNSPRPIIKGNIIGLGVDGTTPLQNYGHGIECLTCDDGIIGGLAVADRNVIACSFNRGIQCVNSPRVTIINNYIGTDVTGLLDRGGTESGIDVGGTSSDVIIGGSLAAANIIAHNNQSAGIVVESSSQHITMTFNSIFCNTGPGIDLTGTSNESVPAPVILSSTANSVNGTGVNGNTIHVYRNVTSDGSAKCNCEGEIYLGTTTVSGGAWSLTHNLGLSAGGAGAVSATQTTPLGSTSEFSNCTPPLPVQLISFSVIKNADYTAFIQWSTASELNSRQVEIQRSADGIYFETIGVIPANGNSFTIKEYSFEDKNPLQGISYYRLSQTDIDGKKFLSEVRSLDLLEELSIIGNKDGFTLIESSYVKEEIYWQVYSMSGVMLAKGSISASGKARINLNLAMGIYVVHASEGRNSVQQKILIGED